MTASSPKLPYSPGLDGIRALAVLGIIAYHVGFGWCQGAFYGVDTFFVLSGYLITSLLIVEWDRAGTIALRRFWAGRARRLLPALFVLVAGLAVLEMIRPQLLPWPDAVPDAAATLGYVANWHFIATSASYFGASSNSPLLHTWSLAIEEQFYLLWPLVVLGILKAPSLRPRRAGALHSRRAGALSRRNTRLGLLLALSMSGALASFLWMWHLTPDGETARAYYGTDARAQSLLVGAALAVFLKLFPMSDRVSRTIGTAGGLAGAGATAAIWYLVPFTSTLAFHGGFILAALASAGIVGGAVLAPRGVTSSALSVRPVRYVGRISYAAYLWYWPVFLVLSTRRQQLGDAGLFVCVTSITLLVAAASSKFVEMPIRRGSLTRWRAALGAPIAAGLAFALVAVSSSLPGASLAFAVPPAPSVVASAGALGWSDALLERPAQPGSPALGIATLRRGPVRVLIVGDSMAGSLAATLSPYAADYGVVLIDEGQPGCSLATDSDYHVKTSVVPPGQPCVVGHPDALLDQWKRWVDEYKPDVVVYLARADLFDEQLNGSWTWIGQKGFDRFLVSRLRSGLAVLGSEGAPVVLLTSPYYESTYWTGGTPYPEDDPQRVASYDRVLSAVASSVPDVNLYPFGELVSPGSGYSQDVAGVNMRCLDGVHLSIAAGEAIAPELLPYLVGLGESAKVPLPSRPTPLPAAVPSWYPKLYCG